MGEHRAARMEPVTQVETELLPTTVNWGNMNQEALEITNVPEPGLGEMTVVDAGMNLLCDIELDATLQFGSREMPLREILELGPGDVVELDRHVSEPVDLVVGDRIVARGEVVVVSGNFALRITEVAAPQLRLESIRCLF
jgi:flagellar motor switch protein FliN/FliY